MIVADASVVADLLLGSGSPAGDDVARRLTDGESIVAPDLVDVEVGQVLRRFEHQGEITSRSARTMVRELIDLPVHRYPARAVLERAFQLRANVTIYDSVYLALAEALDVPLLTGDHALANVPGCRATVLVVPTSG